MNADRALCGYALPWRVPTDPIDNGREPVHRDAFDPGALDTWLAHSLGVPLDVNHDVLITHQGVHEDIGTVRYYRADSYGLLVLAEVSTGDLGDAALRAIDAGQMRGLSAHLGLLDYTPGTLRAGWTRYVSEAVLLGVALGARPAFGRATPILATGPAAMRAWEEEPAPDMRARHWARG